MSRRFKYWAACPDFSSGEIIHYITDPDRSQKISYQAFARHVDLEPLRRDDHPAMYRISAPDNWAISFHKSSLPDGQPIYYFDWSRIEHIFIDPADGVPTREEMAERARQLEKNPALPLAAIEEDGFRFQTGVPVTFPFIRNTEPSPYLGAEYQQDIEPAGRYMLLQGSAGGPETPGWERGTVTFKSPLVIAFNTDPDPPRLYNETSWKQVLADHFGLRGDALSRALMAQGYDGIVTVSVRPAHTKEIVDLTPLRLKAKLMR